MFDPKMLKHMVQLQRHELTDHYIYKKLAKKQKNEHNRKILEKIAEDEYRHYMFWKHLTNQDVQPRWFEIGLFSLIARLFGLTFGIRLKEKGEEKTQYLYAELRGKVKGIEELIADEEVHEDELINALEEDVLHYVGSAISGLFHALSGLLGAMAGLTFMALDSTYTPLIGFFGLLVGFATTLSIGTSEYFHACKVRGGRFAFKLMLHIGFTHLISAGLTTLPYFLISKGNFSLFGWTFDSIFLSLAFSYFIVLLLFFLFNFYVTVAKNLPTSRQFLKLVMVSLGVLILSALVGFGIGHWTGFPPALR